MMYHMKNIINHNDVELSLPKCMYHVKNPIDFSKADEIDININQQVIKLLKAPNEKMAELEQRQDLLLKKLDILYDRIKTISSYCSLQVSKQNGMQSKTVAEKKNAVPLSEEIIVVFSPDYLPLFLKTLISQASYGIQVTWHIHSSVPKEKVQKIMTFVQRLQSNNCNTTNPHLRLIFKNADSELILSSLAVPIVGNVNVLRYLFYVYPNNIVYDFEDYNVDGLLDICHILERTSEKNKEALINNLFSQCKNWIYNNKFSIVDLAAYNIIKQWRNVPKSVPKNWFENCNKLCA